MSSGWQRSAVASLRLVEQTLETDVMDRLRAICRAHNLEFDHTTDVVGLVRVISKSVRARGELHVTLHGCLSDYIRS